MEGDLRSTTGDDGSWGGGGLAVTTMAAYDAAIPKETIHRVLRQRICCVDPREQHPDATVVSFRVAADWGAVYTNNAATVSEWFDTRIKPALANGMLILACDDCEDVDMTTTPIPLFLLACQFVLMAHAMGCELSVGLPASQLGCPGTSLSLRHALRCMMKDPDNPSKQCSARGVAELFQKIHSFLVH
jgi:hypothetical protein